MAYYETAKLSSWNDAVWSYNWCNADWNDDWDDLNDMGHPNPLSHRDIRCIYDENQKLNKNGEVSSSNEMYGNIESPAYLADIKGEYYLWILLGWETEGYYDQYSDKDYALISVREPASQETYDVQASHIPHYLYHLNPKHPSGGMYAYTYKFFLVDDAGFADERHECDRDTGLGYMLCYYSNQFPYSTHGALANVVNDQLSNPIYTSKSDLSSKEGFDFESRHDYIGDSVTINRSDLGVSYTMIAAVSNTKVNLGQLLVRGEDAIIFPDKYDNIDTYNKGYVYRTCKTYKKILGIKTNKCKEWNDYKYYEVYKDSSSHKVDNNGNLIYSDLEAVKMVMPSFEIINSPFSIYL